MNTLPKLCSLSPSGSLGWIVFGALTLFPPLFGAAEVVPEPALAPAAAVVLAPESGAGSTEADVLHALRAGDVVAADRILDEVVEVERAAGAVQFPAERRAVDILAGIAFSSYGGSDQAVAVRAATALIARAGRTKLDTALDRAAVAECAGEMAERIIGDREAARRWYMAALQDDPSLDNSRRGLARLDAGAAAQAERARETEAARTRASEQPPLPQPTPLPPVSVAK